MLEEIKLNNIQITSPFWTYYLKSIKDKTLPFQYQVLNDELDITIEKERKDDQLPSDKSNALENLRIAAGLSEGEHYGWVFQDSDVYKWLEAVSYSLISNLDEKLKQLADEVVDLIASAQMEDGYLSSYFQIEEPQMRYRRLDYSHELYNMGHLLEAAVAYHEATGNPTILSVAQKMVAHLDQHFGREEGKIAGADGHQEIEIGLLKYYELTHDHTALQLAEFFLEIRGEDPQFYHEQIQKNISDGLMTEEISINLDYLQAYTQPKNQQEAKGHAVRLLYMTAAMARTARLTQNQSLKKACIKLWHNITQKKMYITGGVGSTVHGEAFTGNYDLPNDTMYCETCASIALIYFAYELFKMEPRTEYIDVLERALYNGVLSGASLDGTHFFYVNPLEVHCDIYDQNPNHGHVKAVRPDWLGCACCPPNFARTISSIQRYYYTVDEEKKYLYANLFAGSLLSIESKGIQIEQTTQFPYNNQLRFQIKENEPSYSLMMRIPYWAENVCLLENGERKEMVYEHGFLKIETPQKDSLFELSFDTPVFSIKANDLVVADSNRLAIQRGPFVYCAEQLDNLKPLQTYRVNQETIQNAHCEEGIAACLPIPKLQLEVWQEELASEQLYIFNPSSKKSLETLTLIPYFMWANRKKTDMMVWLHQH